MSTPDRQQVRRSGSFTDKKNETPTKLEPSDSKGRSTSVSQNQSEGSSEKLSMAKIIGLLKPKNKVPCFEVLQLHVRLNK